jgi:hypothetical protein
VHTDRPRDAPTGRGTDGSVLEILELGGTSLDFWLVGTGIRRHADENQKATIHDVFDHCSFSAGYDRHQGRGTVLPSFATAYGKQPNYSRSPLPKAIVANHGVPTVFRCQDKPTTLKALANSVAP